MLKKKVKVTFASLLGPQTFPQLISDLSGQGQLMSLKSLSEALYFG